MVVRCALAIAIAGCGFGGAAGTIPDAPVGGSDAPVGGADAADAAIPPADALDGPAVIDGAAQGLRVEAEDYTTNLPSLMHGWTLATDILLFSGTGFMEALPDAGASCTDFATVLTCAPSLHYQLAVPADGTYFVHVRMLAMDGNEDSIWYGIDGIVEPTHINQIEDSTWKWELGAGSHMLGMGPHSVDLWMREPGARVDVIALSTSATPPP